MTVQASNSATAAYRMQISFSSKPATRSYHASGAFRDLKLAINCS
jgi:hypothetical protein